MPSLSILSALLFAGASDPGVPRRQPAETERDPVPGSTSAWTDNTGTVTLSARSHSYEPPPTLPPAPPDPLRQACRVCGAATGAPCDPERLGKAGKRGATAHRGR